MPQDLLSLKVERKTKILTKIDSLSRIVKKTSMWNSIPAWTARFLTSPSDAKCCGMEIGVTCENTFMQINPNQCKSPEVNYHNSATWRFLQMTYLPKSFWGEVMWCHHTSPIFERYERKWIKNPKTNREIPWGLTWIWHKKWPMPAVSTQLVTLIHLGPGVDRNSRIK